MAVRNIIRIDEGKCNGCGDCVPACHEGALAIIDGKARLVSETYCDGLGACLGKCPQGAITIEERDSAEYDAELTTRHIAAQKIPQESPVVAIPSSCPGSAARTIKTASANTFSAVDTERTASELRSWPVQLKLVPPSAPFLNGADILLCADCVPFAVPDFHQRFLASKVVLVGCPKLDDLNLYHQKLIAILSKANPHSLTILKMEVPCCTGIAQAAIQARAAVCPELPTEVFTIGIGGEVRKERITGTHAGIPLV